MALLLKYPAARRWIDIPAAEPSFKTGEKLPCAHDDLRALCGQGTCFDRIPALGDTGKRNYALGGCSLSKVKNDSKKNGFGESARVIERIGQHTSCTELMQGISPFDDSAGTAEWQTSRAPIRTVSSDEIMRGSEGGARTAREIAASTMTACHFMTSTIKKVTVSVNVKF